MRNDKVKSIGDYIREQREQARISVRQLASATGVSNPYLSQIERGLRKPSADILQQIAKGLRISAEALYVQAGILEDRPADSGVRSALLADADLSERQKQVLIEIYESFRKENAAAAEPATEAGAYAEAEAHAEAQSEAEALALAEAQAAAEAEAAARARAAADARPSRDAWAVAAQDPDPADDPDPAEDHGLAQGPDLAQGPTPAEHPGPAPADSHPSGEAGPDGNFGDGRDIPGQA